MQKDPSVERDRLLEIRTGILDYLADPKHKGIEREAAERELKGIERELGLEEVGA